MQALHRASTSLSTSSPTSTRTSAIAKHASLGRRPSMHSLRRMPDVQTYRVGPQLQAPSRGVACQGLFGLGLPEIAVIAGIAALVFGPSKLPELGKGLGKTVKSFQTAAKEFETELKQAAADADAADKPAASSTEEAKKEVKKE